MSATRSKELIIKKCLLSPPPHALDSESKVAIKGGGVLEVLMDEIEDDASIHDVEQIPHKERERGERLEVL